MASEYLANCTKCGQALKNVIYIDGLPYGEECATVILGIKQFPYWFKGGDWNKAKEDYDKESTKQVAEFDRIKNITSIYWTEYIKFCKAYKKARYNDNEFQKSFISSIASQLGYPTLTNEGIFETYQEAESNWKSHMGSFPYITKEPRNIESLSSKQLSILDRIL